MKYKILNNEGLIPWVKDIESKNKKTTRSLLKATLDNDPILFVDHIEKSIGNYVNNKTYEGGDYLPKLNLDFVPGHMNKMPADGIKDLYKQLNGLPLDIASSPYFWGALTLQQIKDKKIEPLSLAYIDQSKGTDKRLANLTNILNCTNMNEDEKIRISDSLARRIIRSLCGPGVFRGFPELISDCSLAKAWWCGKFAWDVKNILGKADLIKIITALKEHWGPLADKLAGRVTVLREERIIAGITLWLMKELQNKKSSLNGTKVRLMTLKLSQVANYRLLCFSDPRDDIAVIIADFMQKSSNEKIAIESQID